MTPSWYLIDAEEIAQKLKYTFYKPSLKIIEQLKPGDICKLMFEFKSDNPEHPRAERMWVVIESIDNDNYVGRLDNEPIHIKDLKCGDAVLFSKKHIIDLTIENNEPNLVEKYLDQCFATKKIIYEKKPIGYFYREEPMEGEKNGFKDIGWRFLEGNESQEEIDDPENAQFISLGYILNMDDTFITLLDSPVGSAFIRDIKTNCFKDAN